MQVYLHNYSFKLAFTFTNEYNYLNFCLIRKEAFMPKQLTLSERIVIERMLSQDYTFASIARRLERSSSTISREILKYRCFVNKLPREGELDCVNKFSCQRNRLCLDSDTSHECYGYRCKRCPDGVDCTQICNQYISSHCSLLDKPPYVCTNCKEQKTCKKNHAYYTAHRANAAHIKCIKLAHSGIRKTPEEIQEIGKLIKPLILKGQSLNHICTTHCDELGISEKTLYNYIDQRVFDVKNIDLPKKVVYRKRRERKVLTKLEYKYRQGRTYEDFLSFIKENPDLPIVEMDTVKGNREKGKVMLTMIFRKSHFMLIFLMPDGTQKSVLNVFDTLTDLLGLQLFRVLFPVILTDNGVEFKDPESLEYTRSGCPRTRLFYCDPQASWQKPLVENNHRLIRRILPKGTSFNDLSKDDTTLILRHINSVLREQLQDKTPFDLMDSIDEKKLLLALNLSPIPPDEVMLRPALLKK